MIEILESYSQSLAWSSGVQSIVRESDSVKFMRNSESSYPYAVGKFHVERQLSEIIISKVWYALFTSVVKDTWSMQYKLTLISWVPTSAESSVYTSSSRVPVNDSYWLLYPSTFVQDRLSSLVIYVYWLAVPPIISSIITCVRQSLQLKLVISTNADAVPPTWYE